MTQRFVARSFDPMAFARAAGHADGQERLADFARLAGDLAQVPELESAVSWTVDGELRLDATGVDQAWLHLKVGAALPLICQRCLGPVLVPVRIERLYRFVADESVAEAQDDACEEDLLALQRDFNLHALIEDELLMELPLVPRHCVCPVPVKLAVADPGFEQTGVEKPNAFAALAGLHTGKPG